MLIITGVTKLINIQIIKMKVKRLKIQKNNRKHFIFIRIISKLLYKLQRIRERISKKKITSLVKHCKTWYKNHLGYKRKIVSQHFDRVLALIYNKNMIRGVKSKVINKKIIFIQREMKLAISQRIELYEKLLKLWSIAENNLFNDLLSKEKADSLIVKNEDLLQKIAIIPRQIKIKYIQIKIKEITSIYSMRMKSYNTNKKMFSDKLMMSAWYTTSVMSLLQTKPKCPEILNEFSVEILQSLISRAMKERGSSRITTK